MVYIHINRISVYVRMLGTDAGSDIPGSYNLVQSIQCSLHQISNKTLCVQY